MPTTTAAVIISDALKEILVIGEGEAPSATMLSDGLRMLNRLLDTFSNNNDFAYFASMEQKALTGQQAMTIGPTGDIVATRPIKVETAVVDRNGITYPVKVIDNEKYEYKFRDFEAAEKAGNSLAPRIAQLNQIRRDNPALQQLRNLRVHQSDDSEILVYSKHLAAEHNGGKANTVLVVVNTDPHSVRETMVHLDLSALGVGNSFKVTDLITGQSYNWGEHNYVRLDSFTEPAHIFRIER